MLRIVTVLALAAALLLPQAAAAQPAVTISVDRGAGATYVVGEPVVIRYTVPQPTFIRILATAVNGTTVVTEGTVDGPGQVVTTVNLPIGQRTLTLQTYTGSQLGATAQTGFNVVAKAATDPQALACGANSGQLASAVDVDNWTFEGQVAQQVTIRLDSPFPLPVRLLSPSGAVVATGTNGFSAAELATNGTYTVQVGGGAAQTAIASVASAQAVPYSLELSCGGGTLAPAASVGSEVALGCGGAMSGQLASITDAQSWTIHAPAGQQLTISTQATVPLPIRVFNPDGSLLTAGSTEVRNFVFPAEGDYTVQVGNGNIGNAPAPIDYSFSVSCSTPPVVVLPHNLPCNTSVDGKLQSLNDTERWVFAGVAGRTVTILVSSAQPLPVRVVDPNGNVAGSGTNGAKAIPITFNGQYTVFVGGGASPDPGSPVPYTIQLPCSGP